MDKFNKEFKPLAEEARKYKSVEEFRIGLGKKLDELWQQIKKSSDAKTQQRLIDEQKFIVDIIKREAEKRMTPEALKAKPNSQIRMWAQRDAEIDFFTDFYNQAIK